MLILDVLTTTVYVRSAWTDHRLTNLNCSFGQSALTPLPAHALDYDRDLLGIIIFSASKLPLAVVAQAHCPGNNNSDRHVAIRETYFLPKSNNRFVIIDQSYVDYIY
jgi:hypothetical protein